jgi:hypothetical protein
MLRLGPILVLLGLGLGLDSAHAAVSERRGTLAVVNLTPQGAGHEIAGRARETLAPHLGGWAREQGIAAYLEGRPHSARLPSGETGRELGLLCERLRAGQALQKDLSDLGRLLGVDYLLLVRVRGRTLAARLFSVGRGSYAPQGYEAPADDLGRLRDYVREQTRAPARPAKSGSRWGRWWIWALAAGVGALTVGLALGAKSDESGDLRIRVSR